MARAIHAISEDLFPMATSSPWRAKWRARLLARVDNPNRPISADICVCMNEKSRKDENRGYSVQESHEETMKTMDV